MTGGTGAMKNTLFEGFTFRHIPREQQIKRMKAVIREELTELQRYTIMAYYFENKNTYEVENFFDSKYYVYKNGVGSFVDGIENALDYDFVARLFNVED